MIRKLSTIREIQKVTPIEGADAIELATIEGWQVITKKGEFNAGEFCMYFEIDSFLPATDERFSFLMKRATQTFEGVKGHKLRTITLRGQLSQGLALPLNQFSELSLPENNEQKRLLRNRDFSTELGIKKFEPPVPVSLSGAIKGSFPSWIRKTDQERCQNLVEEIFVHNAEAHYEVSLKLDGTSVTYYHYKGEYGACTRNLELELSDRNKDNTIIKLLKESGLSEIDFEGYAVQGELMGPGIQTNRETLKVHTLFVFDIYDIKQRRYLTPQERQDFLGELYAKHNGILNKEIITHIPLLEHDTSLQKLGINTMADLLAYAEGASLQATVREGVVFKRTDGAFTFKVLNNTFLTQENN